MRRLISLIAIGSALVLATNVVVLARGQNEIRTTGDEKVVPNAMVQATIRFTPGMIKVANGEVVTWTYDDSSGAPHTATVVEEFPGATLGEIFGCGAPGEPCAEALAAHGALGPVVDVGAAGFNQPGDSLFFAAEPPAARSISATVTAPAGTTLQFLCAIHPWMQGKIVVG